MSSWYSLQAIDMLVNEGDNVLIESPTFSGSIDGVRTLA